ncbi:thioredoxin-related transmembrane protein 1-like [Branchiostoma floridae x Branchiostoma belcheri]
MFTLTTPPGLGMEYPNALYFLKMAAISRENARPPFLTALCVLFFAAQLLVCGAAKKNVAILTEDNWTSMLEGEWMVEFYAPWCPACRNLQSTWEEFADWGEDLEIQVGKVDVTEEAGLSGRFGVTSLPTIYHVLDGEFRKYTGSRTKDDFISFVDDKKWEKVEPVESWKAPNSFLMSCVSWLFKISMAVRTVHTSITEDYGIPVWGSYCLFAAVTIVAGLLIGMVLVFITDCLCPAAPPKGFYEPIQMDMPPTKVKREDRPTTEEPGEEEEEEEEEEEDDDGDAEEDNDANIRKRRVKATAE